MSFSAAWSKGFSCAFPSHSVFLLMIVSLRSGTSAQLQASPSTPLWEYIGDHRDVVCALGRNLQEASVPAGFLRSGLIFIPAGDLLYFLFLSQSEPFFRPRSCRVLWFFVLFLGSTIHPCVPFWELGPQDLETCWSDPLFREHHPTNLAELEGGSISRARCSLNCPIAPSR